MRVVGLPHIGSQWERFGGSGCGGAAAMSAAGAMTGHHSDALQALAQPAQTAHVPQHTAIHTSAI